MAPAVLLGLGGRRPCCAGRPAGGGSGSWRSSSTSVTSLAVCWWRRAGVAAGAFSPGVGAHHTGDEPM